MKVLALAKGVQISPRKVQEVASLVRGRSVDDALVILSHVPRRAAIDVRKTIESAKANASHNHKVKTDNLQIAEISVTSGPSLKRYRPASHGRALPFKRRSSHIRVVVEGDVRAPKADKKAATKPAAKVAKKEAK